MSLLQKRLDNFPNRKENDFLRLQSLVVEKEKATVLTALERRRLGEELSAVEGTGVACVILFFYDTVYALKEVKATFHSVMNCSFLLYFLGITKVNPMDYGLPFERYFHEDRKNLPSAGLAVQKGGKGRVMQYLKERYGADRLAKVRDTDNEYVFSARRLTCFGEIEQTILHTGVDERAWHEDICSLSVREACGLGLYSFTLQEGEIGQARRFTDEEIYRQALCWLQESGRELGEGYLGNEAVEKIFACSHGRYLYQEQFYELCEQLLGLSYKEADGLRRGLLLGRRAEVEGLQRLLCARLGEEGERLFTYLLARHRRCVCKAYLVGALFLGLVK